LFVLNPAVTARFRAEVQAVKKRLVLIIFVVLLLAVAAFVYVGQYRHRHAALYYSGTMEADTQSELAFQVAGAVKVVRVDEGQAVSKGQVLAELGPEQFEARRDQARADLDQAIEGVKQLQSVLQQQREILPAQVEKARAAAKALESRLAELKAGYRPREVQRARLALDEARVTMEEARKDKKRFDTLYQKKIIAAKDRDAINLKYTTALKEYERARQAYALMKEGYRKEAIETAEARVAEGRAALKQAQANLAEIEITRRKIKAAGARVQLARASLDLAKIQLSYTQLKAPFDGILVSRNVEPGEVVSPGREVLSVADLSRMDLKVFVDETEIGKVKPGQSVDVKIDTFPGKVYAGTVSYISPEAEFTPKIIQTRKERVKLVYLVKISIDNPQLELKPGMPADAWFK
jgi:HlyD family secretion protein